jgi:hypothetical protein
MANGKRGRPMTAVDVKLRKLLSDVAYIQDQVNKDERVAADQRPALNLALKVIGDSITETLSMFVPDSVDGDSGTATVTVDDHTGSEVIEPATPDTLTGEPATLTVDNLNAVVENPTPLLIDGQPLNVFSSAEAA